MSVVPYIAQHMVISFQPHLTLILLCIVPHIGTYTSSVGQTIADWLSRGHGRAPRGQEGVHHAYL